jgi:hypothetical protein
MNCADANDAEFAQNGQFLTEIENELKLAHDTGANPFILIHHKLKNYIGDDFRFRLNRNPRYGDDLNLDLSTLLAMIPRECWPRIGSFRCPNPHCSHKEMPTEEHLQTHGPIYEDLLFREPLICTILGLMGIKMKLKDIPGYYCVFEDCGRHYSTIEELVSHIYNDHNELQKTLFEDFGGFWGPMLYSYHIKGYWPHIGSLLQARLPYEKITFVPLHYSEVGGYWLTGVSHFRDALIARMSQPQPRPEDLEEAPAEPVHHHRRRHSARIEVNFRLEGPEYDTLRQRMNKLAKILSTEDLQQSMAELFSYINEITADAANRIDEHRVAMTDPVLCLLAQGNLARITGSNTFCPYDGCTSQLKNVSNLMTHLRKHHSDPPESACDLIRFYLEKLSGRPMKVKLRNKRNEPVDLQWDIERCHNPKCEHCTKTHCHLETHLKVHPELLANIQTLGWFWGNMRTMIKNNPQLTIAEAIGSGKLYQCTKCQALFSSVENLNKHFAAAHPDRVVEGWVARYEVIKQTVQFEDEDEERLSEVSEEEREEMTAEEEAQGNDPKDEEERRPQHGRRRRSHANPLRIERVIESDDEAKYLAEIRVKYIEEAARIEEKASQCVNVPPMNTKQIRNFRKGLESYVKTEVVRRLEQIQPEEGKWDEWKAFEAYYTIALDKIRKRAMVAMNRDPEKVYLPPHVTDKVKKARETRNEKTFNVQQARKILSKLRVILDEMADNAEDTAEARRKQQKLKKRVETVLSIITEEMMTEAFGTTNYEQIWQELDTNAEQRARTAEWLEAMITSQLNDEVEKISTNYSALNVQESWRTSKGPTLRRYITKEVSPKCTIDPQELFNHFEQTWSSPEQEFFEADSNSPFYLETNANEGMSDLLENFMLKEENIEEVIKSRNDLSASGPDGITYRMIKAMGKQGVQFMKSIIKATLRCGRVFQSWKEARTVLIYKKGDRNDPHNWRPISITNCIYRIYTCLMARAFQAANKRYGLYSDRQKGFIQKTNGCSENAIMLNELFHDANRKHKDLIATTIDFTNAFGSVPHQLILSTLKQRRFPKWIIDIIKDMHTDASSTIEIDGFRSDPIAWRKGVKQGCPLSPLLFNLCLEPLIQAIEHDGEARGAFVHVGDDFIEFLIQAYADDVLLLSQHREGIERQLEILKDYVDWSRTNVNVGKSGTSSFVLDENGHRSTLAEPFMFKGEAIPNFTRAQSVKYLGTPVAARRNTKLKSSQEVIQQMVQLHSKIINSRLLIVQKIDAVKTFVLPKLDFLMMNGEVSTKLLTILDQSMRGSINSLLKIRGLPIECHYASWRDGGLSYPCEVDRSNVLAIRSLTQMVLSEDLRIRAAMRQFLEDERQCRQIEIDENGHFHNWSDGKDPSGGTSSLIAKARKACRRYDLSFKITKTSVIVKSGELEHQTKSAIGIGRFLTQRVIRPRLYEKLIAHATHGATYTTLEDNPLSNKMLIDRKAHRSDAFFRFTVAGRADCLPTPANIERWYGKEPTTCHHCDKGHRASLAHILNACTSNYQEMTQRHNRLSDVVRKAIIDYRTTPRTSDIHENTNVKLDGLSADVRDQRPDLHFETEDTMELIEISCPYGQISHNENTLTKVYHAKRDKYQQLAHEIERIQGKHVRITVIIVSSMGAIYHESLDALIALLGIAKKTELIGRIGRRMSETVIVGSMNIWRKYAKQVAEARGEARASIQALDAQEMQMSSTEEKLPEDEDEIEKEVEMENENEEEKMARTQLQEERLNRKIDLSEENDYKPKPEDEEALIQVDTDIEADPIPEEPEPEPGSDEGSDSSDSSGFFAARRV